MSNVTIHYARVAEYIGMKTRLLKLPFSGTFELTPRCNMNCRMCYIRMTPEEMARVGRELTVEQWLRIAQEAVDEGMTMLLLTGGEPILYHGFRELFLRLRKMGLFISINSNATMLNDEWIEFFRENPPAKFNITLYGGSNETYDRLCRNPRGFDQVRTAIEKLQAAGIEILLNCTLTRFNIDDLEQMAAFADAHRLQLHATTYNFPPVRKEGVDNPYLCRPTPREAAQHRVKLNWYTSRRKEDFLQFARQICSQDYSEAPDAEARCEQEQEGDGILCAAGRSNFWVTWDGRMLPCGIIPELSVPIEDRPFREVWDEITARAGQIRLSAACAACKKKAICAPCAAKLAAETGSFDSSPGYLCEYTDEYIRLLGEAVKVVEHEQKDC